MLAVTVQAGNFVVRGLKTYDQDPVVGSGRLGEECDCRERNAVESLAEGVGHRTAVAVDCGSIDFEGHLVRDSCSVDTVGIDCALACRMVKSVKIPKALLEKCYP